MLKPLMLYWSGIFGPSRESFASGLFRACIHDPRARAVPAAAAPPIMAPDDSPPRGPAGGRPGFVSGGWILGVFATDVGGL